MARISGPALVNESTNRLVYFRTGSHYPGTPSPGHGMDWYGHHWNGFHSICGQWNGRQLSSSVGADKPLEGTVSRAPEAGKRARSGRLDAHLIGPLNKSQYPRPGVCRAHAGMTVAGSGRIWEAVVEMPSPYSYGNSPYHRATTSSTFAASASDTSALNAATRWQIPRSVPSQSSE